MGQRRSRPVAQLFLLILVSWGILNAGCGRNDTPTTVPVASVAPTVVSLVPAATDLIVGMGAANHLVGVSNYDLEPQVSQIRRVGDYLTTDWERIAELRPQIIISQYAPGRTPAGFEEHCRELGARQENLHIDRLADIFTALARLGDICKERQKADDALARLRGQLQRVRDRASRFAPTPVLLVIDETGLNAAGPRTFLDDLLTIAGGKNVIGPSSCSWPAIDRETLLNLSPEVILQLLPDASTQMRQEAADAWRSQEYLPAVRNHRIIQFTDGTALLPGYHVGDLAEQFERALHPTDDATQPATTP